MQVDDVDSVTFAKDVFLHLWIPALGLVPEVNAGFEQFFHANGRQTSSSVVSQVTVANPHHGPKRDLWASQPICWPRMNSDEAKEIRVYVRPKKQPSAWRTGSVCGRPSARTSCARAGARRASADPVPSACRAARY